MRVLFAVAVAACHPSPAPPAAHVTEYRDGLWFDGATFPKRTLWVVGDRFATTKPTHVDEVVDLHGACVVPPYGEGHNHWLEPALVDAYIATHLRDGIFYVKDQSTAPAFHDAMRAKLNTPTSVDYIAAHQGFTGPMGHPIEIIAGLAQFGLLPKEWARTLGADDALFVVTSEAEVDRAFPRLLAGHPDFVKVFLVHSDEYAARRDNAELSPKQRGLDPALVPGIVRRAHAAHLKVSAHIENAHDFHVAIDAGADWIAHLPFVEADKLDSYKLADADISALAARHGTIATTLDWAADAKPDDPRVAVERDNIKRLRAAGVTIVVGTDRFRQTARVEVDLIVRLQLMSNLELLHAWSIDTPRSIFPDRKLASFTDGAEASFLVLGANPLTDFANTANIQMRVKEGQPLHPADTQIPPFPPS